jgi:hypothetical protein
VEAARFARRPDEGVRAYVRLLRSITVSFYFVFADFKPKIRSILSLAT